MNRYTLLSLLVFFLPLIPVHSGAEGGRITSHKCPYNCMTARLSKTVCRDWREGDMCYIEDLRAISAATPIPNTLTPGYIVERGKVSSKRCPYHCGSVGLSKNQCKDWRVGNTCYVEDLSGFGASPPVVVGRPPLQYDPRHPVGSCTGLTYDEIISPRVDIYEIRKTGTLGKSFRIKGTVEGVCLTEAGVFERGGKTVDIAVTPSRNLSRIEFSVAVSPDDYPEIRVYNVAGDRDVYRFHPDDFYRYGSEAPAGGQWLPSNR